VEQGHQGGGCHPAAVYTLRYSGCLLCDPPGHRQCHGLCVVCAVLCVYGRAYDLSFGSYGVQTVVVSYVVEGVASARGRHGRVRGHPGPLFSGALRGRVRLRSIA
jgi:hypothetical protein